jgi:lipopolysaccharide export LptBFGC system permease protein LptF
MAPNRHLLSRYLLGQLLGPLAVALLLLVGVIWLLQALRLGHHLLGAGLDVGLLARVLLYSLPTLALFALPFALAAAVLFGLGRLAESHQLLALRLAGAAPRQIAGPCALLCLGAALGAVAVAALEPPALQRLQRSLAEGATRTLVRGAPLRRFHSLGPATTLYVEERDADGQLHNLLLAERGGERVLLARSASVELDRSRPAATLSLHEGEVQTRNERGGLRRIQFQTLRLQLDLGPAIGPHLAFVGQRMTARAGRLLAPLSCLALGLLATALALRVQQRLRLALVGLLAATAFQLALWGVGVVWPGALGAGLVAGGVAVASLVWLTCP